jgi:hypothetical protein
MFSRLVKTAVFSLLLSFVAVLPSNATAVPDGSLLWQVRFFGGNGPTAHVAVSGNGVFVAGKAPAVVGGETGWLVTAYDAGTGAVRWHNAYSGPDPIENNASTIAISHGLVIVGGFASASRVNDVAMIRVYDQFNGALRWQDRFDYAAPKSTIYQSFAGINWVVSGDETGQPPLIYAVGRGLEVDGSTAWFVRAYNEGTGALLWASLFHDSYFDDAISAAFNNGRLYVSGFTFDIATKLRHFTVRAYDARSGSVLWEDQVPGGQRGFFGSDIAEQVVADGNRVIAAGEISDDNGFHFAVRAYDAATGSLIWNDLVNDTGDGLALNAALANGNAYVVGLGGAACNFFTLTSNCDGLIRAYDENAGTLLWSKQVDGNGFDDGAKIVLACGDSLAVAGYVGTDDQGDADWLIQVLNASDGSLSWQDYLPTPGTLAVPAGLAVSGNQLFETGSTSDSANNGDYIVRALQFGSNGQSCNAVSNNAHNL